MATQNIEIIKFKKIKPIHDTIVVTDMLGQSVYSNSVFAGSGNLNERVDLANNIASGMYLVTVTSGEHHVVFHVVVDK